MTAARLPIIVNAISPGRYTPLAGRPYVRIRVARMRPPRDCHINRVETGGGQAEAHLFQLVARYAAVSPVTARHSAKRVFKSWGYLGAERR